MMLINSCANEQSASEYRAKRSAAGTNRNDTPIQDGSFSNDSDDKSGSKEKIVEPASKVETSSTDDNQSSPTSVTDSESNEEQVSETSVDETESSPPQLVACVLPNRYTDNGEWCTQEELRVANHDNPQFTGTESKPPTEPVDPVVIADEKPATKTTRLPDKFVKISNSGNVLPDDATLGNGPDNWACSYDQKNQLLWEVKTDDDGLRDKNWSYTWYDPGQTVIGGNSGTEQHRFNSSNCKNGDFCNTNDYKKRVNTLRLCGAGNWSVPTLDQLNSLYYCSNNPGKREDCGAGFQKPTIQIAFFPNTILDDYWSTTTLSYNQFAWYVNFKFGYSSGDDKDEHNLVRLVARKKL